MTGKKGDSYSKDVKKLGVLTTVPIILLIGPTVGFFIGRFIDRKAQLYPWFTIIFIGLGLAAAGREIVRLLKEVSRDDH